MKPLGQYITENLKEDNSNAEKVKPFNEKTIIDASIEREESEEK